MVTAGSLGESADCASIDQALTEIMSESGMPNSCAIGELIESFLNVKHPKLLRTKPMHGTPHNDI